MLNVKNTWSKMFLLIELASSISMVWFSRCTTNWFHCISLKCYFLNLKAVIQKIYSYQPISSLVFLDASSNKEGNNICHVATSWIQGLFPLYVMCNRPDHHHHHGLGIKRRGKLMFIFLKFTLIFDLALVQQQKKVTL